MQSANKCRCHECGNERENGRGKKEDSASPSKSSPSPSSSPPPFEFWWCRDCAIPVCNSCHLIRGHCEHRGNAWSPEEVFRSTLQALEGRCSRRAKTMHDTKLSVKQFLAKVEVVLLNELSRALEAANEPDRFLISRLNTAIEKTNALDERPSLYHLPSPSRPAWKTWNLDSDDPVRMAQLIEEVSELLQLPRREPFEEEVRIDVKDRSSWNVREAVEAVAGCLGAQLQAECPSTSSWMNSPVSRRAEWSNGGMPPSRDPPAFSFSSRRRCLSSETASHFSSIPLEPAIFVRERPSVNSFRERSVTAEETASPSSPEPSHLSGESKPMSVMSSLPAYPHNDTLDTTFSSSTATPTPLKGANGTAQPGPSSSPSSSALSLSFGQSFLTRPICVLSFSTKSFPEAIAVSDSCGGVFICSPSGRVLHHLLIKNSSASSLSVDELNQVLYVSVMQAKGRSVHVFDLADSLNKLDTIVCPREPKIELSRTRWITVGPRGQLFMTSGDNSRSALWVYVRGKKGWKTLKESKKTRYQYIAVAEDQAEYKAVVLLTCDAANNRLLLFVVDHSLSLINEYDLSKTYRLNDHIVSPASAIVDKHGNLLVLDYATGKLWALLSGVKGVRRLKEVTIEDPLQPQEALGITTHGDYVLIACFNRLEVRAIRYIHEGSFHSTRSPSSSGRSASLGRPEESVV